MIRFVCDCGKQLQAREENAGRLVRCPACQRQVTVPSAEPTAIQEEEPHEQTPPSRRRVQREQPTPRDDDNGEEERRPRRGQTGSSGKALASLLLGIFSFCGCACLTGLPAILMGVLSLRDIGRAAGMMTGKPMALIGILLGSLGTLCLPPSYYFAVVKIRQGAQEVGAKINEGLDNLDEAGKRQQSLNNLKQMSLAMHNYNDTFQSLPSAGIDGSRKPVGQRRANLSWRVALLPFMEEIALFQQFKLDEPWDGPNNIKLLGKMPKMYKLPGDDKTPSDHTHYQVFVGNGAAFEQTRGYKIGFQDFPDGTSTTILIAEVEKAVPWTKPEDVAFDPKRPVLPLMSTHFRSGFHVALADGSTRQVRRSVSETTLKYAIMRNDGMPLGADW